GFEAAASAVIISVESLTTRADSLSAGPRSEIFSHGRSPSKKSGRSRVGVAPMSRSKAALRRTVGALKVSWEEPAVASVQSKGVASRAISSRVGRTAHQSASSDGTDAPPVLNRSLMTVLIFEGFEGSDGSKSGVLIMPVPDW